MENDSGMDDKQAPEKNNGLKPKFSAAKANDWVLRRYKKLSEAWLTAGYKALDLYEAEGAKDNPFNMVYSNTETISPGLYNATPQISVANRYATQEDQNAINVAAAQAAERAGNYFADSNDGSYETFDDVARAAVFSALTVGQGQGRVRLFEEESETGVKQCISFEACEPDRFLWAYCRRWTDCPRVAFGHDMIQEDFEEQFAEWIKENEREYKAFSWPKESASDSGKSKTNDTPVAMNEGALLIWEIHEHSTKTISFICDKFKESYLKIEPYQADLSTRFPCPMPLAFARKIRAGFVPIAPFEFYKEQFELLQVTVVRLNRVTDAIRVRGVFNGQIGEIKTLLGDDKDNALIAAENIGAIIESGGLDKHIWFLPIDELIKVAEALMNQVGRIKQEIYEVTGISDIQRGASNPNETKGAQEIKNKWGVLRLKHMQRDVAVWCRDLFRIAVELAGERFSPDTWAAITQLPYPTAIAKKAATDALDQAAAAQQQYQALMQRLQQGPPPGQGLPPDGAGGPPEASGLFNVNPSAATGGGAPPGLPPPPQAPSVPGAGSPAAGAPIGATGPAGMGSLPGPGAMPPPPPPPPPPDPKAIEIAGLPDWDQIAARLHDQFLRDYSLDIETNSTVDLEATEDKENVADFMNGVGQFMAGITPLFEAGMLGANEIKMMLMEICKMYPFGRKISYALEKIKPPQGGDGKAGEAQAAQAKEAEMAQAKAKDAAHQAEMAGADVAKQRELLAKDVKAAQLQNMIERLQLQLERGRVEKTKVVAEASIQSATNTAQNAQKDAQIATADAGRAAADGVAQIDQASADFGHERQLADVTSSAEHAQRTNELANKQKDVAFAGKANQLQSKAAKAAKPAGKK